MRWRYPKFCRGLLLVVVVAAYTIVAPMDDNYAFASSPAAGACSDTSGEVICNVSGEQLDFSRTSSPTAVTQTDSSSSRDIGVGLALDSVIRYEAVFTGSDGTVVDALVTIDSLPGGAGDSTYIMDQDRASADDIKPIDMSNLQGTLSVEVSFVDDSDSAVKLQNMQVVTKDLDLAAGESAQFSGLVSYSLSSGSYIQVDDSVAGVRTFTSNTNVGMTDEKGWVSVTFPTTSTVGLTGNISATSRSIPFDFDARSVWSSSPTVTAVSAASYEVSFDLDGGSGDLPAAISGVGQLTFPLGTGQSKGGFDISGWSSGSGGSGTRVALGGGYTPISDTTFYAVYGYRVSFDANGGSGSMSAQTVNSGAASAINANSFTRSGYSFSGWNTAADGSGTAYSNGANITTSQSVTLYAQWAEEFDVTFSANGGSGSMSAQTAGGSTALTTNAFTRTGYAFAGWNTEANGSGTAYADGAAFPFTADDTLFAQWAEEFDVTFSANGGSGSMSAQTAGGSTALTTNAFTRTGYAFAGWNTEANGSGTAYADGAAFPFTADDILYAQWTLAPSGGSGESSGGSSAGNPAVTPTTPTTSPRQTRLTLVGPNTDPVPRHVERLGLAFDPDAPSRATVGGALANLVKTPEGSDRLSVEAGAFQFGVSLADADGAEVQTDTPSQSPELFVPRGQSAAVSGKGSYPGSFVQLFLPGNGNDSRELARIPVRSDGTFASDLSFEAGAVELPVPIGRQVLQVVGYDEQGNQTVVDMTINIGQGVPAPEPNRQIGELPALTAGQSLATSGGIPETVSVTGAPETGNVVVEGSGWVISVNAERDNGVVENADGNVLVRLNPSSVGTTFGNGFLPGTLATVWLFSEPTLMTAVTVDDNGEFSAEFLVDARLIAPGEHTLQVQGVGSDGYIKAANLGVLVEQPVEVTAESASGLLWWVVGAFLLVLLFLLLLLARRRRSQEQ